MMKRVVLFVLMVLVGGVVWASTIPTNLPEYKAVVRSRADKVRSISDEAKFYLVTCEPGEEIYERFGHSGIRVYDPVTGIDEVFHWGLFSFDTPNFIGRFISGNTDYEMGVYSTKFFVLQYIERGSAIYAQELDFTPEQKHEFWARLWENYRPENRKYRYNFIYDNCATRPYQLVLNAYNYDVALKLNLHKTSYRDIINKYVPTKSILNTGINLIIGKQADKHISTQESAAFPLYTMDALNHSFFNQNGTLTPIVKDQVVMHKAETKVLNANPFVFWLSIIIPLILALVCIFYSAKHQRYLPIFTQLMLFISGLVGVVIFYLGFFSHHPLVSDNMNLLWCNPLNIILAILLLIRHKSLRNIKFYLSLITYILSLSFIIVLCFSIQETTIQIFSIWILMSAIYRTIVKTYNYKVKNKLHKSIKK